MNSRIIKNNELLPGDRVMLPAEDDDSPAERCIFLGFNKTINTLLVEVFRPDRTPNESGVRWLPDDEEQIWETW